MTQDPGLSAEQVAELEKKLAAASAEMAKVQAQLAAATGNAPPTTAIPPYGAGQLTPQQLGAMVASQVQTQLSPQAVEQLQKVMQRLGLDQTVGPALGFAAAPPSPPSPEVVGRLADPPRPVPLTFRLATFDWSWWEFWFLGGVFVIPLVLWITEPRSFPVALVVLSVGVLLFRGRRYLRRMRILKWGKVATVTGHTLVDKGTYYSGMTYNNMLMRSARGWTVTRQWYSGPGYTTDVAYTLDGTTATLRLRGLPYVDGVVLADSRQPTRAMCVHHFPYDLTPGEDGQWQGQVSIWRWLGICLTLVMECSLLAVTVILLVQAYA